MAKFRWLLNSIVLLVFVSAISGCMHSAENRMEHIQRRTVESNWIEKIINTSSFRLAAFLPESYAPSDIVYIYIEGDGLAWLNRETPSADPTPKNPLALELALRHGAGSAYLARPCQYTALNDSMCRDNKWWTSHRFAPEVIIATNQAIDEIKHLYQANHIILIGYSGGGAVATLIAARRSDVLQLVTVAGNLDTEAWTDFHGVRPLSGSLNPADQWQLLQNTPQLHFFGKNDKIVPYTIGAFYADRFPADKRPKIVVIDGYDHACCWIESLQIKEFYASTLHD